MIGTLLAQSVTHAVTSATIIVMWRKPPANMTERYGVRSERQGPRG